MKDRVSHKIQVAYALTMLDSANTALQVALDQADLRPVRRYAHQVIRPTELANWADLWGHVHALPQPYHYPTCVASARRYLAEHLDEALAWERTVDPTLPTLEELVHDQPDRTGPAVPAGEGGESPGEPERHRVINFPVAGDRPDAPGRPR